MKKTNKEKVRICLDCRWMHHSRNEWECGRCEFDDHKIDHINNHDWCNHWSRIVYEDEFDENPEEPIGFLEI